MTTTSTEIHADTAGPTPVYPTFNAEQHTPDGKFQATNWTGPEAGIVVYWRGAVAWRSHWWLGEAANFEEWLLATYADDPDASEEALRHAFKAGGIYAASHEAAQYPAPEPYHPPFQSRVAPWMQACFGPDISADRLERGDRLLEEVLELLQSGAYPAERVAALTGYVWNRPAGEPAQEVGGVMVTLAAYCLAHGLDMHESGETELARIWTKVEQIRAKQAAKLTGSALPQAWPDAEAPTS